MPKTICLFAALVSTPSAVAGNIDFARDIRPILSDHCFACHGPDANKRKAELRLDLKEPAFGKAKSGAVAIVPGDLEKSELIRRICATDPDDVMPPPKELKVLKPEQVELLKQWVKEGAKWTGHWSFEPVKPVAVPDIPGQGPIDAFVQARLAREGLKPAPEENPARLLRRVSLDLTGLPPSVAEVDAFMEASARDRDAALSAAVDKLMASPHFGERLAVPWLDLARYGDTSGYHNDSLRDMWLWREWVIKSFNAGMPFDRFTIEQIAGDLLPNASIEQKVASGFHRNVMTSDEGGLIEQEYLNLYIVDRVATTGVTWLGLTVACAQCHDHKYDPVTQKDFYQVYAFFHNVPENGKDGVRDRNPQPFLQVPSAPQLAEQQRLDGELAAADKQARELGQSLDAKQPEWEKKLVASGQAEEPKGPWVKIPLDADGNGASDDGKEIEGAVNGEGTFVEGSVGNSYRVEQKGWIEYGDRFGFEKDQPFTVSAWLRLKPQGGSPFGRMEAGGNLRGWDVEFHGTKPSVHLSNTWPANAIHVQGQRDLPANEFLHFAVTYDGSGKGSGVRMYVNGQLENTNVAVDTLTDTIKTPEPFSIGRRGATAAPFTGRVDDFRAYDRALPAADVASLGGGATLAIAAIPADKRTPEQIAQLQKLFRETQAPEFAEAQKKVADLRKAKEELEKSIPNTMVMSEMEKPRDTFIKVRGQYDQDGEKVAAGVPGFLPQIPPRADGKSLNRVDFAKWLVSQEQPLTARVTVNRWWAMLFGNGLVKTVNDFGSQGEWPSHAELLDWLAGDFMTDWNTKRVLKQIVMSATYRQSARVAPELLARDSENRLLARGPRQRLDAEIIRDNALAIAGILNPQLGGRSIKPEQPPGTWEINEMGGYNYDKSKGADLYRRGLYVYWRRSTVYPSFVTLDAPTREFCSAQRAKTSTPLQSLVLMNDPVFVEAARAFAQRILKEGGADNAARLRFAWRTALARMPADKEIEILARTLDAQLLTYDKDKTAAAALVKIGDLPKPDGINESELAAWTALGNVLLNLNETITN
jgi:mono/diheme cytochrome c family protein